MFEYQKLNQQLWDSYSNFNHAKNYMTDMHETVQKFLETLLEDIQHEAGLIYAPMSNQQTDNNWTVVNLSPQIQHQIDTQKGEIPDLLKRITNENEIPDKNPKGIALISPLTFASEFLGLFVLEGDSTPDIDLNIIKNKTELLSEKLYLKKLKSNLEEYKQEITALKNITRTQSAENDINSLQIEIINSIRTIFRAEETFLIEFNKDNSNLGIKKHLGLQNNWLSQEGIIMEEGLIWQSVFTKRIVEIIDVQSNSLYNPNFDGVQGVLVQSIIIVPLHSEARISGVLTLINTPQSKMNEERKDLLLAMTSALINAMANINLFQQLKIVNENLETSRWELLNSRNTLRALFDSIPASMYIIDQKFILQAINMSRANRINQPPNKLVGGYCYEKLFGLSEPCPGCRILETYITGRITSRIHRQWIDDERFVEWEITTYPIQNEENVPIQAILIEQDVTDKRNLEANLIQSEKLAAVGQLAAGVAHEINNPLAAIIANAQLLLRDTPEDNLNLRESLNLIEIAGSRASQVVKNLLGFARKEQYNFELIHLNETVTNALSLVQHEVNSRSIKIKLDLSQNMPLATASKDHLQGVWINLIMNAIDAFENEPGEILISTKFMNDKFTVSVSDNGKGISPEKLNRIFEPFFTTKSVGRGTGLGLSVCHRIIKKHGGLISAKSKPNNGATFTVTLPASPKFKITSN